MIGERIELQGRSFVCRFGDGRSRVLESKRDRLPMPRWQTTGNGGRWGQIGRMKNSASARARGTLHPHNAPASRAGTRFPGSSPRIFHFSDLTRPAWNRCPLCHLKPSSPGQSVRFPGRRYVEMFARSWTLNSSFVHANPAAETFVWPELLALASLRHSEILRGITEIE